jgi:predicted DNA-binding protein
MGFLQNLREKLDLKKIQKSIETPPVKFKKEEPDLKFKVGTTSGIYQAARSEELADIVSKLSYTLTRGAACLELASDVPHEVNYTQGKEVRNIAEKQDVDITFHGSLTVAIGIPERTEWEIAQDHMKKSIKSAVHAGALYTDFHSCLREWLELFTYSGSKLEIVMCDHKGRFIKDLFVGDSEAATKLRKWFVNEYKDNGSAKNFVEELGRAILGPDETQVLFYKARDEVMNDFYDRRFQEQWEKEKDEIIKDIENSIEEEDRIRQSQGAEPYTEEEKMNRKQRALERYRNNLRINVRNRPLKTEESNYLTKETNKAQKKYLKEEVEEHLKEGNDWFMVERAGTLEYAYRIIAHYMFFSKDKMWKEMIELYKEEFEREPKIKYDENDDQWLERALVEIENMGSKQRDLVTIFKEFYYGVVASKFLEGHIVELVHWMGDKLPDIIDEEVELAEPNKDLVKEHQEKLKEVIENLSIAIENPDSRDPRHAGRYLLWRPKQIYIAIKNIREKLKDEDNDYWDNVHMLMDFEHLATQGVDPLEELTKMLENDITEKYAKLVKTVHSGVPTPLHSHKIIGPEDREIVYRLLWKMREAGLGSEMKTYLIFERGGGKDPYAGSVKALKDMKKLLEEGVEPGRLPGWFFEIPHPKYEARQRAIIFEHTFDPIKGLLKFPEEEYTLLGSAAIKAGKRPEEWKKEELR